MRMGPLTFVEIFESRPWGGRALGRVADKRLPPGERVGECWEIADRPNAGSIVAAGPLRGASLTELVKRHPLDILGRRADGRFPLLIKLLDCRERLSIQVHPDDAFARRIRPGDRGKIEAWYVVRARAHAEILGGARSPDVVARLRELALGGVLPEHLRLLRPRQGEVWLCRPGALHALGPGVVLLEVQTNSDITFRLYDWGRVGREGRPRPVHIEEAVAAVGGKAVPLIRCRPRRLASASFRAERLVRTEEFVMDQWRLDHRVLRTGTGRFEILHVLSGVGRLVTADWPEVILRRGRTILVPASVGRYEVLPLRPIVGIRIAESG